MKYMNVTKKYQTLDLQLFADGGEGDDGEGAGDGDDEPEGDDDDDPDEKKFSQKEVDDTVKKRLAREKRKWQREHQNTSEKKEGSDKDGADGQGESEDARARKIAEDENNSLKVKVACYESGVSKDAVDDVTALAESYMKSDENLDLEEAIEKVVKKYPQFRADYEAGDGEPGDKNKGWGQRHNRPPKKEQTVDDEIRKQLFGK